VLLRWVSRLILVLPTRMALHLVRRLKIKFLVHSSRLRFFDRLGLVSLRL